MNYFFRYFLAVFLPVFLFPQISVAESWENGIVHRFLPQDYQAGRIIWSITQDQRGVMYFSNAEGILEFDSTSWRLLPLPDNRSSSSLLTDARGRVYVGGDEELGYLAPDAKGNMEYISLTDKLAPEALKDFGFVLEIGLLDNGELAFLFEQNLLLYQNGGFTTFSTEGFFYNLTYDHQTLYVLDSDRGLMRVKGKRLVKIPEGDFFRAHFMLPYLGRELLIITQDKGILIYDPLLDQPGNLRTLERESFQTFAIKGKDVFHNRVVMAGLSLSDEIHLLAVEEVGLELFDVNSRETALLNQFFKLKDEDIFTIFQDAHGGIWLGTSNGIIAFFPENSVIKQTPKSKLSMLQQTAPTDDPEDESLFSIMIRAVENIEDDARLFGGTFFAEKGGVQTLKESKLTYQVLPFEQNALRFTYVANDFVNPKEVQYQSYLEGMEDDWSKWSKRQFREYTNLTWRDYTFHVRALRLDGTISEGNGYSFEIFPPWYERWWFYASQLAFLLSLLGVAAILRGMGIAENLSDYIIAVVVLVCFVYLDTQYEVYIEDFAGDVLYIKVLLMVCAGLLVEPLQHLAKHHFSKISIGARGLHKHNTDKLTGLGDRNYFTKRMKIEIKKTRKKPRFLSVIILDIDSFRQVNDDHGLECGDAVLVQLSKILTKKARDTDIVSRYWGEKFIVSLFELDNKTTESICERIRKDIEDYDFHFDEVRLHLTASVAAAVYPDVCKDNLTLKNILHEVDAALTHSRTLGPNRIFMAPVPKEIAEKEKQVDLGPQALASAEEAEEYDEEEEEKYSR